VDKVRLSLAFGVDDENSAAAAGTRDNMAPTSSTATAKANVVRYLNRDLLFAGMIAPCGNAPRGRLFRYIGFMWRGGESRHFRPLISLALAAAF
jgi:hypothetical protein